MRQRLRILWCLGMVVSLTSLVSVSELSAAPLLKRVEDVRSLPPEEAQKAYPVELEVQILHVSSNQKGIFVHDGDLGIYVANRPEGKDYADFESGDLVQVTGKTAQGQYFPIISPEGAWSLAYGEQVYA